MLRDWSDRDPSPRTGWRARLHKAIAAIVVVTISGLLIANILSRL